jgi:hypothetical protein
MQIYDTPVTPELTTRIAIVGLSQPLVDVAAVLSLQDKPHHARALCEAAWILESVGNMPQVVEWLTVLRNTPHEVQN